MDFASLEDGLVVPFGHSIIIFLPALESAPIVFSNILRNDV